MVGFWLSLRDLGPPNVNTKGFACPLPRISHEVDGLGADHRTVKPFHSLENHNTLSENVFQQWPVNKS